jgi:hypothetical protein
LSSSSPLQASRRKTKKTYRDKKEGVSPLRHIYREEEIKGSLEFSTTREKVQNEV